MNAKTPKIVSKPRRKKSVFIQRNAHLTPEQDKVLQDAMKKSGWQPGKVMISALMMFAPIIGAEAQRANELLYQNLCSIQAAYAIHKPTLVPNEKKK